MKCDICVNLISDDNTSECMAGQWKGNYSDWDQNRWNDCPDFELENPDYIAEGWLDGVSNE